MTTNMFGLDDSLTARDERVAREAWHKAQNLYDGVVGMQALGARVGGAAKLPQNVPQNIMTQDISKTDDGGREDAMNLFKTVRPNIVQSIRAFRVADLAESAASLGQHFLYANCSTATTKSEVLDVIAREFLFPKHFGKNFDALADCLTDMIHKAGPQPGFVIVLEGLPCQPKFDKEAREVLLDVFRDAAEFWAERKVQFRVFYSFA
ncbi:barstar family protein [Ralstonia sp. UBA689]|uniref:barstar family protein n=1 Tax=Ralstonia sp. UBA689 TaxID=1947373 RepID=UPI0025F5157E|nr:barstar family protein [Ralstonia sp. UBA689]